MEIFVHWTTKKKKSRVNFKSIQWNDAMKTPHINFDVIHYRYIHTWYFFVLLLQIAWDISWSIFPTRSMLVFAFALPFFPSRVHFTHVMYEYITSFYSRLLFSHLLFHNAVFLLRSNHQLYNSKKSANALALQYNYVQWEFNWTFSMEMVHMCPRFSFRH